MATTAQRLGPKYQVTIPKPVRDALGLKVGDLVETTISRAAATPYSRMVLSSCQGSATIRSVILVRLGV